MPSYLHLENYTHKTVNEYSVTKIWITRSSCKSNTNIKRKNYRRFITLVSDKLFTPTKYQLQLISAIPYYSYNGFIKNNGRIPADTWLTSCTNDGFIGCLLNKLFLSYTYPSQHWGIMNYLICSDNFMYNHLFDSLYGILSVSVKKGNLWRHEL